MTNQYDKFAMAGRDDPNTIGYTTVSDEIAVPPGTVAEIRTAQTVRMINQHMHGRARHSRTTLGRQFVNDVPFFLLGAIVGIAALGIYAVQQR